MNAMVAAGRRWLTSVLLLGALASLRAEWQQVFAPSFTSAGELERWHLDGHANVGIERGELRITTRKVTAEGTTHNSSVLWLKQPHWGDLRIRFRCRGEPGTRAIVFFNARGRGANSDILAWPRPLATYGDYAYEPRLELYSMGILRSDLPILNLRRLGGDIPEAWMNIMPYPPAQYPQRYLSPDELRKALSTVGLESLPPHTTEVQKLTGKGEFRSLLAQHARNWRAVNDSFQAASIIANHDSTAPVFAESDKSYQIEITAIGHRVEVKVDGRLVIDCTDTARASSPLRGGYLGFRNFSATTTWYRDLQIERQLAP